MNPSRFHEDLIPHTNMSIQSTKFGK